MLAKLPLRVPVLPRAGVVAFICLVTAAPPAEAQLADRFASHFGAARLRENGIRWSASAGLMLLSQYGSRWKDTTVYAPGTVTDYGDLKTTVGYNYVSAGVQGNWVSGRRGIIVVETSVTMGVTSDKLSHSAQDGLHDFRRFPHVRRGDVTEGVILGGLGVEVAHWWSWFPGRLQFDVYPSVGMTYSTFHREVTYGVGAGFSFLVFRFQTELSIGDLFGQSSIEPSEVGDILAESYATWGASIAFDRRRFRTLSSFVPSGGIAVSRSSGIFKNRPETLMSIFLDFPSFFSNDSWRIEHVNDLLGNKDRGPTGGVRLTYVAR